MSTSTSTRPRVVLALVTAAVAISFAAIFFKKAEPTNPLVAAGVRLAIAAVILAPFTVRAARAGRLPRRVLASAAFGGVAYALHFGTWVTSLGMTSVAASVTLVTATPLLLAVFALVTRRDQPEPRHWIAIGLAIVGLALVGSADASSRSALLGDALAFAGAASMAAYMLLVRRCGDGVDVWAFSGIATTVGGLLLLGVATATGVPIAFPSAEAALFVGLAALVPQLVGHTLLTWALRHTRPTLVGIATVGEPVGSTLLGAVWLGQFPGPLTLIGCAVTLAAVITALFGTARLSRPNRFTGIGHS